MDRHVMDSAPVIIGSKNKRSNGAVPRQRAARSKPQRRPQPTTPLELVRVHNETLDNEIDVISVRTLRRFSKAFRTLHDQRRSSEKAEEEKKKSDAETSGVAGDVATPNAPTNSTAAPVVVQSTAPTATEPSCTLSTATEPTRKKGQKSAPRNAPKAPKAISSPKKSSPAPPQREKRYQDFVLTLAKVEPEFGPANDAVQLTLIWMKDNARKSESEPLTPFGGPNLEELSTDVLLHVYATACAFELAPFARDVKETLLSRIPAAPSYEVMVYFHQRISVNDSVFTEVLAAFDKAYYNRLYPAAEHGALQAYIYGEGNEELARRAAWIGLFHPREAAKLRQEAPGENQAMQAQRQRRQQGGTCRPDRGVNNKGGPPKKKKKAPGKKSNSAQNGGKPSQRKSAGATVEAPEPSAAEQTPVSAIQSPTSAATPAPPRKWVPGYEFDEPEDAAGSAKVGSRRSKKREAEKKRKEEEEALAAAVGTPIVAAA